MAVYIAMFVKGAFPTLSVLNSNLREVLEVKILKSPEWFSFLYLIFLGKATDLLTFFNKYWRNFFLIKILTGLNVPMI